jgi:hypothetical protein
MRVSIGVSCYACGGSLFQLSSRSYFCPNAHCSPGGRVMRSEDVSASGPSSSSKCILDRCTAHGRGLENEDAGNGSDDARTEEVPGVSEALA